MGAARGYVRVWEVLADGPGEGPAADGTFVHRFRSERDAKTFAATNTVYGRPCNVNVDDVPRRLAQRWGVC